MGPTGQQNFELPKYNLWYTGLHCVATWKTWQDRINASIVGAPHRKQGSRKRTPWLQAKQDGDALPLLRSCDGNVSCRGNGLSHHAYWQMVEQCISTLHQKASGAILAACCKTNAHVLVVSNNTIDCTTSSFNRGPQAVQPPRQCQDKTQYWRRHVLMGATAIFFPLSANWLMIQGKLMEEASSSRSPKGSGEGRIELKTRFQTQPPQAYLVCTSLITYRRGVWLQSCFIVWMQIKERKSGDRQTKKLKCTHYFKNFVVGQTKTKRSHSNLAFWFAMDWATHVSIVRRGIQGRVSLLWYLRVSMSLR